MPTASEKQGIGSGTGGFQPLPLGYENAQTDTFRSLANILSGSGANLTEFGYSAIQKPIDYWSKILSGNKAEIGAAMAPELSASNQQFESQRRVLDQYTPMGGGRSANISRLGQERARTNAGIISKARAEAAPQLAQAATAEQQLGMQQLATAIQAILGKFGVDVQEGGGFERTMRAIEAII